MRRALLTIIMALALFGGIATFSGKAQAGTIVGHIGYVCSTTFLPFPGSYYGNYGAVSMTIYTGVNCSGSYITAAIIFSTGATGQGSATLVDQPTLLRLAQSYASRVGSSHQLFVDVDNVTLGYYYGDI
jgi:hypothetical protein